MADTRALPRAADVVIVGGGIMGTSAAFFLTERTDLDVVLLEKDSIAAGSTGDSSAILRHHYGPQERYTKMAWWSHQFYRAFREETGEPIAHEENPLVRVAEEGTRAGEYAMDGYDVLSAHDIPASRYDRDEFEAAFPMIHFEEFDFAVSDDAAGYSDGFDAANGFARAARDNGATVVTGVEVTDVVTEEGAGDERVAGVETDRRAIECENVVLAAGPWTPRLAETVGVSLPITVEREQVVVLEPPEAYAEAYPDDVPTTALPGGTLYMRPDFGDGVLVATHHSGEEVDPDDYDDEPDQGTLLELTRQFADVVPELVDAGIRGKYCGVYSTTPDHDFIVDQLDVKGCYVACGFSGHGFKHGPAIGKILADLVAEGETDLVDVDFFSLDRFSDDPAGHGLPDDYA